MAVCPTSFNKSLCEVTGYCVMSYRQPKHDRKHNESLYGIQSINEDQRAG